ncbi:regulatory protein RecX [Serinibacter salmoneus]|uniref:regulatory protein RecX n=1 Tax=Serinibacter salmoneus TaxID=556530 RepID=UPI001FE39B63|nr:regulatory protein RecX [Serinibacter salmoneus]
MIADQASPGRVIADKASADETSADDRARRRTRRRGRGYAPEPPASGAAAQDAEADQEQVARTIALRQLAGMPRSRAQLAEAMARKDVPEDVTEKVLDRLEDVGLVDDAEYAAMLVRSKHADRGLGRRALAHELQRKGIDQEVAQEALASVGPEEEERVARELVRKRVRATIGLEHDKRVRRIVGMLARKGYGAGLAYRLVSEELSAEAPEAADMPLDPFD